LGYQIPRCFRLLCYSGFYTSHKVASDATHAAAKGVLAGTDVEYDFGYAFKKFPEAVKKDLVTEEEVNIHLMHVLIGCFDLGEMGEEGHVRMKCVASIHVFN